MKQEVDQKIAFGLIVALILIAVGIYYFAFRAPSGELSAEQAGMGKPMRPGELPPGVPPPPWQQNNAGASSPTTPSGQ